jgi:hypothetical protein
VANFGAHTTTGDQGRSLTCSPIPSSSAGATTSS